MMKFVYRFLSNGILPNIRPAGSFASPDSPVEVLAHEPLMRLRFFSSILELRLKAHMTMIRRYFKRINFKRHRRKISMPQIRCSTCRYLLVPRIHLVRNFQVTSDPALQLRLVVLMLRTLEVRVRKFTMIFRNFQVRIRESTVIFRNFQVRIRESTMIFRNYQVRIREPTMIC